MAVTPIWMFEGAQELDPVAERNLVERRFSALARPCDLVLYRRMRQILAEEGGLS